MPVFITFPNPVLTTAAVSRPVDASLLETGQRLLAAAIGVGAYGLAAAHLGLPEPVIVVSMSIAQTSRDYRLMFNPVVTNAALETASGLEGSVSLPGIEVPVERAIWVEIAFEDTDGTAQTVRLDGFAARVAQHEIDQMNGVFFLGRISRLRRDAALRKFRRSARHKA